MTAELKWWNRWTLSQWWLSVAQTNQNLTCRTGEGAAPPPAARRRWTAGSCTARRRCLHPGSSAGSLRRRDTRCGGPARAGGGGKRRRRCGGSGVAGSRSSPGGWGTCCGVPGIRSGTDPRSSRRAAGRDARGTPRGSRSGKARSRVWRASSPSSSAGSSPSRTCPQTRGPASRSCPSCPLRSPWAPSGNIR